MRRGTFFDTFPVTSAVLLLCLAIYGVEVWYTIHKEEPLGGVDPRDALLSPGHDALVDLGGNFPGSLREGQLWRLIAYAFLHGDALHILFNMWVLVDAGRICEARFGRERFAAVYVASAIGGGLASAGWQYLRGTDGPAVGASAAILGLVGLLLGSSIRHHDRGMRDQLVRWLLYIAVFGFLFPMIDNAGHAGGLAVGLVFGFLAPRYVSSRSASLWRIPFALAVLAVAASLGFAAGSFWQHY